MTTTVPAEHAGAVGRHRRYSPIRAARPIKRPTVTLLVDPEQAETLTLAGNEGRIQLVLRNSSDQTIEKTSGRFVSELYGASAQAGRRRSRRRSGAASDGRVARSRKRRSAPPLAAGLLRLLRPIRSW